MIKRAGLLLALLLTFAFFIQSAAARSNVASNVGVGEELMPPYLLTAEVDGATGMVDLEWYDTFPGYMETFGDGVANGMVYSDTTDSTAGFLVEDGHLKGFGVNDGYEHYALYTAAVYDDFIYEVVIDSLKHQDDGDLFVLFRAQTDATEDTTYSGYALSLNYGYSDVNLMAAGGGEFVTVILDGGEDGQYVAAPINEVGRNVVSVKATADTLEFYVNSVKVVSVEIDYYDVGYVGIGFDDQYADSQEVWIDQFSVIGDATEFPVLDSAPLAKLTSPAMSKSERQPRSSKVAGTREQVPAVGIVPSFNTDAVFQTYNVYRDGDFIGSTADTSFQDQLPAYGSYTYAATRLYDEGESIESNPAAVYWKSPPIPRGLVLDHDGDGEVTVSWNSPSTGADVYEDFEDGFADFFADDPTGTFVVDDGVYGVHPEFPEIALSYYNDGFNGEGMMTDGVIEVEQIVGYDTYNSGVVLRSDGNSPFVSGGTGYYFYLSSVDGTFFVVRHDGDGGGEGPGYMPLVGFDTPSEAINTGSGETNIVAMSANGATLTGYINGVEVFSVYDDTYTSGYAGVAGDNSGDTWESIAISDTPINDQIIPDVFTKSQVATAKQTGPYPVKTRPEALQASSTFKNHTKPVRILRVDEGGPAFQQYNVYRDETLITSTTDSVYVDMLPDYGIYGYEVTAVYDVGESSPTSTRYTRWAEPPMLPPSIFNASRHGGDVSLAWDPPMSADIFEPFDEPNPYGFQFSPSDAFLISDGKLLSTYTTYYEGYLFAPYTDFAQSDGIVEVELVVTGENGYAGVATRMPKTNVTSGFSIFINPQDAYFYMNGPEDYESDSSPWINTRTGDVNVVTLSANGMVVDAYINGHLVATMFDPDSLSGYSGPFGSGGYNVWESVSIGRTPLPPSIDPETVTAEGKSELATSESPSPQDLIAMSSGDGERPDQVVTPQYLLSGPSNMSVTGYGVYRDGALLSTVSDTTFQESLVEFGSYKYNVTAIYDVGESNFSHTEMVNFLPPPVNPPSAVFAEAMVGEGTVQVSWQPPIPVGDFVEDFEDGEAQGFSMNPSYEFDLSDSTLKGGGFGPNSSSFATAPVVFEDGMVKTSVTRHDGDPNGDISLIVRQSDVASNPYWTGYIFSIRYTGVFGVFKKNSDTDPIAMIPWTSADTIQTSFSAYNTMAVEVEADSFTVYINQQVVGAFVDDDYSRGFVGVGFADYDETHDIEWEYLTASPASDGEPAPDVALVDRVKANKASTNQQAAPALLGYNIYRNHDMIQSVGPEAVSFEDVLEQDGQYEYRVSALYETAESPTFGSDLESFFFEVHPFDALSPEEGETVDPLDLVFSWTRSLFFNAPIIAKTQSTESELKSFDVPLPSSTPARGESAMPRIITPIEAPSYEYGGPDSYGYVWVSSLAENGPEYNWIDISSTGQEWSGAKDDGLMQLALPFEFPYYGEMQSSMWISSNGMVQFSTIGDAAYEMTPIPDVEGPAGFIAPLWTDFEPEYEGEIYYLVTDEYAIVQWQDILDSDESGLFTFELVLYPDGRILFQYKEIPEEGSFYIVGIESPDQTDGLQIAYDMLFLSDEMAVRVDQGRSDYELQLALDPEFDSAVHMMTRDTTFSAGAIADLIKKGEWSELINPESEMLTVYWRVNAMDRFGEVEWADSSETGKSFQVDKPEPPTSFALISPEDGTTIGEDGVYQFAMSWFSSSDPDDNQMVMYDLVLGLSMADEDTTVRIAGLPDTLIAIDLAEVVDLSVLPAFDIDVDWYVEAISQGDTVASEDTLSFSVVNQVSGVAEVSGLPGEYSISALYPNPFNPTLNVTVGLPAAAELRVVIYNVMGQQVGVLADARMAEGYHTFTLNGSMLASGVYFVRATVPGRLHQTAKVVLMK